MNKIIISLISAVAIAAGSAVAWEPVIPIPQPEFGKKNFLLTPEIEEMNVDFAIPWTDSAASQIHRARYSDICRIFYCTRETWNYFGFDFDEFGYDAECSWTNGNADTADWANPGHQYH